MTRLPPLPTVSEIVRVYGLTAKKQLAQNFMLDLNLTNKFVRAAGNVKDAFVIEIGPGPGGITRSILNTGARSVLAVEKDFRFMHGLEILSEASGGRLSPLRGDILHTNLATHIPQEFKVTWDDPRVKVHIMGNLPFNISLPLLVHWLQAISLQGQAWAYGRVPLTLTFQKEVAERIIAAPQSQHRCRLSVMSQLYTDSKISFIIPGKAFVPPPKVDVGVVHMRPKLQAMTDVPYPIVERVVRHLFHLPNKYCKTPMCQLFPRPREGLVWEIFERSGVDPLKRPFQLLNEECVALAREYSHIIDSEPDLLHYDFKSQREAKIRRRNLNLVAAYEEELLANKNV